jgi:short-subunit dehydrogenase
MRRFLHWPRRRLAGLRAIVTGGSSGLGRALALQLAAQGSHVLATARRSDRLAAVENEWNTSRTGSGSLATTAGDQTDAGFRSQLVETAVARLGGIDLVVLAAGSGAVGRFDASSPDGLRKIMEVDFFAPVELARLCLPALHSGRDPAIVFIGSIIGRHPLPLHLEYGAAKSALAAAAGSLRMELAPDEIDVMLATLGPIASEFWENLIAGERAGWSRGRPMPSERAARSILRALVRRRTEVIPGLQAKGYVLASRFFPRLFERCVMRQAGLSRRIFRSQASQRHQDRPSSM